MENIRKVASDIEAIKFELEEAADALCVLYENFENEGYQNPNQFETWKAVAFVRRYPVYHSTLHVIRRAIAGIIDELDSAATGALGMVGAENREPATVE